MNRFVLKSPFKIVEEQKKAVRELTEKIKKGIPAQTFLGVTGSGKTFTLANVIAALNRPTLVISHNKTLAAQLYSEFKEFFPENAVEYFVSYYDYYQPEAYIPQTDVYIEKDASINDQLDQLRLAATTSLMSRRDVIIVASVSCIYNLGSPSDYKELLLCLEKGQVIDRDDALARLLDIQYERNDYEFTRGKFRVRGDVVEIFPAYRRDALRVEFLGERVERISQIDPVSGKELLRLDQIAVYPAKHFVMSPEAVQAGIAAIEQELEIHLKYLHEKGKLLEAERLKARTRYDIEMLKEVGYCHGIENYSRLLSGRKAGSRPFTLMDYFPEDFLTIIDESHATIPQLNGMYEGDRARKETLVEHGFRLPSCLDNRPLKFKEFQGIIGQRLYVSATPGPFERKECVHHITEQIIRPTGIIDPPIIVRPSKGQIDDLVKEIKKRAKQNERSLVTTMTKRMAEDLAAYLEKQKIKVKYMHCDIETIERSKILQNLRMKNFDCLVGVNLLREGLDLPEVSLVAILDADKEGFLRSQTSLIQVSGRAARHIHGVVIMYADTISAAMRFAMNECERRRTIQLAYNKKNSITPRSIQKAIRAGIEQLSKAEDFVLEAVGEDEERLALSSLISDLEGEMELAARNLMFEKAAALRDKIKELRKYEPRSSSGRAKKGGAG
ncbi:MAG: excinuclease ABC subunit UvrB [Candidatus Omnitrophica bacterium]|nr:excinuclease ABC subunit UvrB [Candidatus Omnitrophota bacterium]